MKKTIIIFAATLTLFVIGQAYAQAAFGIPQNLRPKNAGLGKLNEAVIGQVESASANEQGKAAVTGVNLVLQYFANTLLYFAGPLAILFVARAGADYAFGLGEEQKLEAAKRELTWALVGLALVMFAYLIVRVVIQTTVQVDQTTQKTFSASPPAASAPAKPSVK